MNGEQINNFKFGQLTKLSSASTVDRLSLRGLPFCGSLFSQYSESRFRRSSILKEDHFTIFSEASIQTSSRSSRRSARAACSSCRFVRRERHPLLTLSGVHPENAFCANEQLFWHLKSSTCITTINRIRKHEETQVNKKILLVLKEKARLFTNLKLFSEKSQMTY